MLYLLHDDASLPIHIPAVAHDGTNAGALAIFCVMTAAIFHHQLGINSERTLFFKDLAIAGGLMVMAASAAVNARAKRTEAG